MAFGQKRDQIRCFVRRTLVERTISYLANNKIKFGARFAADGRGFGMSKTQGRVASDAEWALLQAGTAVLLNWLRLAGELD